MAKRYYECTVCGRKFPEGQGIVLEKAGRYLYFHSNKCASKFFRYMLENLDDSCARPALDETIEMFRRALEARREKTKKVI